MSYIITRQDIEDILTKEIIQNIYVSYKGMGGGAEELDVIRNMFRTNTLLVLKAFFCPSHILSGLSRDATIGAMIRDSLGNPLDVNTIIDRGYKTTTTFVYRLQSLQDDENFKPLIVMHGLSRKYDILTKHFHISDSPLRKTLPRIIKETNDARFKEIAVSSQTTEVVPPKD